MKYQNYYILEKLIFFKNKIKKYYLSKSYIFESRAFLQLKRTNFVLIKLFSEISIMVYA